MIDAQTMNALVNAIDKCIKEGGPDGLNDTTQLIITLLADRFKKANR